MTLTPAQTLITAAALALGTALPRLLPPILFPAGKPHPKVIDSLTPLIPPAIIGLLVVYSLKDVSVLTGSHALPELIAVSATALVHLWKRNLLISMAVGTVCYMLLVQLVF